MTRTTVCADHALDPPNCVIVVADQLGAGTVSSPYTRPAPQAMGKFQT